MTRYMTEFQMDIEHLSQLRQARAEDAKGKEGTSENVDKFWEGLGKEMKFVPNTVEHKGEEVRFKAVSHEDQERSKQEAAKVPQSAQPAAQPAADVGELEEEA